MKPQSRIKEIERILNSSTPQTSESSDHKGWCVYILKCRDSSLYTGITNNLEKRLNDHRNGSGSKYVRSRMPFELIKTIYCDSAGDARKLEYHLKRLDRKKKIELLDLHLQAD